MRIAQAVSGRRRWCSTTRPATLCVQSAGWCWSRTRLTRPPSGGLSQMNRAITTRFVSAGQPTRSWPTKGSPPSQPSPTAPSESSSPPPSADGRITVPTLIAVFLGFAFCFLFLISGFDFSVCSVNRVHQSHRRSGFVSLIWVLGLFLDADLSFCHRVSMSIWVLPLGFSRTVCFAKNYERPPEFAGFQSCWVFTNINFFFWVANLSLGEFVEKLKFGFKNFCFDSWLCFD